MNWLAFAAKVPAIIHGAVQVVDHIKNAKGADKKRAVIDAIPTSIELVEFAAGRDLLNDLAIAQLVSAAVDAEAAALKARTALRDGLLAKAPASPTMAAPSTGAGTGPPTT